MRKGLYMIEWLVIVAILIILAITVYPAFKGLQKQKTSTNVPGVTQVLPVTK